MPIMAIGMTPSSAVLCGQIFIDSRSTYDCPFVEQPFSSARGLYGSVEGTRPPVAARLPFVRDGAMVYPCLRMMLNAGKTYNTGICG